MDTDEIARLCDALSINDESSSTQTLDENLKNLGKMIGEVSNCDASITSDGSGRFLRVRVRVPVDKPLRRSLRVDVLGNGVVTTMPLRYERLLDYCFKCGRLGHVMNGCFVLNNHNNISLDEIRKLGVWLRATSPPKRSLVGFSKAGNRNWNKSKNSDGFRIEGRSDGNWRGRASELDHVSGDRRSKEKETAKGKEKMAYVGNRDSCMETVTKIIAHANAPRVEGNGGSLISNSKIGISAELMREAKGTETMVLGSVRSTRPTENRWDLVGYGDSGSNGSMVFNAEPLKMLDKAQVSVDSAIINLLNVGPDNTKSLETINTGHDLKTSGRWRRVGNKNRTTTGGKDDLGILSSKRKSLSWSDDARQEGKRAKETRSYDLVVKHEVVRFNENEDKAMVFDAEKETKEVSGVGVLLEAMVEPKDSETVDTSIPGVDFGFGSNSEVTKRKVSTVAIEECISVKNAKDAELFCVIVWRIWFYRNSESHGSCIGNLSEMINWCEQFLSDFQCSRWENKHSQLSIGNLGRCSWFPPGAGVYKANCDAVEMVAMEFKDGNVDIRLPELQTIKRAIEKSRFIL
ncbi:hypothetical protein EZV62_006548 [Acer yangbiense]|uniref:CCHC-type domain-containing protein n=1 Tax=Acer yangbiense TaxID=1000413 RepID=A0A5C7I6U7_9ROSI|nr:hypothetical protein EZV62_006548 [Acer yangbiense]